MIVDLIFIALALLTIAPAVWVVLTPNIVHAGFALLFTLLGAAGLYAYMGADFIAVTQLMVYVGGVLVLVLFTVMMTRVPQNGRRRYGLDRWVPAAVFAGVIFFILYKVATSVDWRATDSPADPTIAVVGTNLMTSYIFPFEFVSLVLLAAMIGAAILIREARLPADADTTDTEVTRDQEAAADDAAAAEVQP